jgi:ABC-type multidrug transport system permease subunit
MCSYSSYNIAYRPQYLINLLLVQTVSSTHQNQNQGVLLFLPERIVILKERAAGSHRLSAYFITKQLAELPARLIQPMLFLSFAYPMTNMNPNPAIFFAIAGTLLLATLSGEAVGLFVGTLTADFETALMLVSVVGMTLMLTGGFFVSQLPVFVQWMRFISPFKYAFDACVQLEFSGRYIECNNGYYIAECSCSSHIHSEICAAATVSGDLAVSMVGATQSVWANELCLIAFLLLFNLLAYICLRYMSHNVGTN